MSSPITEEVVEIFQINLQKLLVVLVSRKIFPKILIEIKILEYLFQILQVS